MRKYSLNIDTIIFILLFGLLPVDMINGYLLKELNLDFFISISQLYKIIILLFIFISIDNVSKIISLLIFSILLLPSIFQIIYEFNIKHIFSDIIMVIKYLASFIAFFYFKKIMEKQPYQINKFYKWMLFSFVLLVISISLKIFDIGFPMYIQNGIEIGSKGLFYAGNEVSAVFIIISSFLLYHKRLFHKKMFFYLISLIMLITAFLITSKTAIFGAIFLFVYFYLFQPNQSILRFRTIVNFLVFLILIIPSGAYFIYNVLKNSDILNRALFYWNQLDIYSFILSNRNNFLFDYIQIFKREYNVFEILIGVGQSTFEELSNNKITELDFFDIFFSYGFIGVIIFIFFIGCISIRSKLYSIKKSIFIFAPYTFFISIILLFLSFLSGHIFNSGMAAIYIGFVFALMYYNVNYENKIS